MPKIKRKSDNYEIDVPIHSLEYCLKSGDYEICEKIDEIKNSEELEPKKEIKNELEFNELEDELMTLDSNLRKKNKK